MITAFNQRWRDRRGVYRPAGETFEPKHFDVAPMPEAPARAFVERHHYSHGWPAARRSFGLFERGDLVGVAVLSQPINDDVLLPWTRAEAAELGRLVLLDHVLANAESWMVARVLGLALADGFEMVVSHADPVPRTDADGREVFVGHIGNVYQASNALYTGRTTARTLRLLPDGTVYSERTKSKVRKRDVGWRYAVAQLVGAGAPEPAGDLRAWLPLALAAATRKLRHAGNHQYVFPLSRAAKRAARGLATLPYPKVQRHPSFLLNLAADLATGRARRPS